MRYQCETRQCEKQANTCADRRIKRDETKRKIKERKERVKGEVEETGTKKEG